MPESVWTYPRPPRFDRCRRRARVVCGGVTIAESVDALRVLETSHPPTIYFPPADVRLDLLVPEPRATFCEWKGTAVYYTVRIDGRRWADAAWAYPKPEPPYAVLAGYLAFYPARVDTCWLDEERVQAQGGGFYGGWITSDVIGPFKGDPAA